MTLALLCHGNDVLGNVAVDVSTFNNEIYLVKHFPSRAVYLGEMVLCLSTLGTRNSDHVNLVLVSIWNVEESPKTTSKPILAVTMLIASI